MTWKLHIRKHELGLWFRHGDFQSVLAPGAYWLPGRFLGRDSVEVVSTLNPHFEHKMLDVMISDETFRNQTQLVDLKDDERALIWKDGRLLWILGAGRYVFWNRPAKIEVELFNVNDFTFTHRKLETILAHATASRYLDGIHVEESERVLLFRDGKLIEQLGAGVHVYWKGAGKVSWKIVDLREQSLDISGQEIMTADKMTLRLNMVVTYQVVDTVKTVTTTGDYVQALYREAQLALREAVGTRTLDALLADKDGVGNQVRNALAARAAEFGAAIRGVGLRDVILPGEMKTILNEVILAQKQAEANLIRRREETAAARSQANTAKLLAENPGLSRMKELEALTEILKGAKTTFVFGQGDIAEQVRKLVGKDAEN